jgi:phosphoglycolate phosphatase-like HAD superfamily hydrolase
VDLVIFDIDGTLTATNEVDTRCFARAFFDVFSIAIDTAWNAYPHRTDSGIIRHNFHAHFGRGPTARELDGFKERFLHLLEREWREAPRDFAEVAGAGAALARIKRERSFAPAVATGGWRVSALFKLEKGRVPMVEIPAAFADDAEEIARLAITRAIAHYQRNFKRVILVGDSDCDVATASRLRLPFVGIAVGGHDAVLRLAGAERVMPNY